MDNRKSMRGTLRGTIIATAGTIAIALSGCSGTSSQSGDTKPESTPGTGKQTTISFQSWHGESTMRPFIDAFEKENPDIKVELSYSPPVAEYTQTLQTRISGNQAPDVFRTGFESLDAIISSGSALDLSGESFMEGISQANIDAYSRDGKIYGMSVASCGGAIAYNPELLESAGASAPPSNWDEFIALSLKLKESGITPYLEAVDDVPKIFQAFLGAEYEKSGISQGDKAVFDGTTTFEKEWATPASDWYRLFDEKVLGVDAVSLNGDQIRDEFISGRLAMMPIGPWDLPNLEESGMNYNVSLVPMPEGSPQFAAGAPDVAWVIYSGIEGDKLEAAKRLLTFANSEEGLRILEASTGQISTSANYKAEVPETYKETYEKILLEGKYYLCMAHWPKFPDALQVEATSLFQQAVQGSITTEQIGSGMDTRLAMLE